MSATNISKHRLLGFITILILLICPEFVAGQTAAPDGLKATFTMNISLKPAIVKPGVEVLAEVELMNTTGAPITLFRARRGRYPYDVQVWDRAGKAAPLWDHERAHRGEPVVRDSSKPIRIMLGGGTSVTVAPGETLKDFVPLQTQVDLSQPGQYTVRLDRLDPATKMIVKSNKVTLTVVN